jgi:oligoribonuclease NrnB/cAMP/cGMP phosphodiesterase (DHH superfamily)
MAENIEDLTVHYEEDGIQLVKETDKEILSKGAWTTILFKYQEYNKSTQEFGVNKFTIRRYQKRNGQYQAKSKFNISSTAQARKLIEILERWTKEDNPPSPPAP